MVEHPGYVPGLCWKSLRWVLFRWKWLFHSSFNGETLLDDDKHWHKETVKLVDQPIKNAGETPGLWFGRFAMAQGIPNVVPTQMIDALIFLWNGHGSIKCRNHIEILSLSLSYRPWHKISTLPIAIMSPLKMCGWKTSLGKAYVQGRAVSFREGIPTIPVRGMGPMPPKWNACLQSKRLGSPSNPSLSILQYKVLLPGIFLHRRGWAPETFNMKTSRGMRASRTHGEFFWVAWTCCFACMWWKTPCSCGFFSPGELFCCVWCKTRWWCDIPRIMAWWYKCTSWHSTQEHVTQQLRLVNLPPQKNGISHKKKALLHILKPLFLRGVR